MAKQSFFRLIAGALAAFVLLPVAHAQVLPDDRFDLLYHSYEGDQITITGPSLLARKKIGQKVSVSANYYVDEISSASIDVRSYASPYTEQRNEFSLSADYLVGETILTAGYTNSDEQDFEAQTAFFGVAQEVFGGLTTVNLSYARGWDEIGQVTDPEFFREADRRLYRVGLSQVITKNLLLTFDFEGITDEGFLNNSYRQVRFRDPGDARGYRFQPELYPETRTSSAFSLGGRYFIGAGPSAVYANARTYSDTWGIAAWNAELGYTYSLRSKWLFDLSARHYSQTAADFFSDLYPFENAQNFLGRDKEISTFTNTGIKLDVTYDFSVDMFRFLDRGTLNFSYNYIMFEYEDFRNIPAGGDPGEEPLFEFNADVIQVYLSFWF
ncbi:MAG: DUF3570 domain-containing protein [Gammaproteobacteria bacterium]|jgi:hypothetical protein|nr:DUF3570 domain-containing protein [Gammaproteobacteria bacterium]